MHVLITRPEPDGAVLQSRLAELGISASLAPLISIEPCAIAPSAINGVVALVATSRNALQAVAASDALASARAMTLFVVGNGSSRQAAELGFKKIVVGEDNAASLVEPICNGLQKLGARIAYLSGDVTAFDLPQALRERGVDVVTIPAYRSVPAQQLPYRAIEEIRQGKIDTVLIMSPRTASIWADLAVGNVSADVLGGLTYVCLSNAVATALRARLPAAQVKVAARANIEEMLNLIKRLAPNSTAG